MYELHTPVVGNLTRDADIHQTQDGRQFLSFSVAQTPGFSAPNNGGWTERDTMFINLTLNSRNPKELESLKNSLKKGVKIVAFADLYLRSFRRKDGTEGQNLQGSIREGMLGVALMHTRQSVTVTPGAPSQNTGGQVNYSAPQGGSANDPWAASPAPQGSDDPWASSDAPF